jgi:hypothetical protein
MKRALPVPVAAPAARSALMAHTVLRHNKYHFFIKFCFLIDERASFRPMVYR